MSFRGQRACPERSRRAEKSLSRPIQIQGQLAYSTHFLPDARLYGNGFRDFSLSLEMTCLNSHIGLMIGGYLGGMTVRLRLNLPSTGNFYVPAMAAASVIWRIGCTLAGCCYGKETELLWGIFLENAKRHPTMIYEGLFNLAMFFVLWGLYSRIKQDNALLFLYFACYAFFRFWLEFIRVYPPIIFGLTGIQYLCLGILLGLGIWLWQQRFGQNMKLLTKEEVIDET